MSDSGFADAFATHEVLNQPPPLEGHDLFAADPALREALPREGGGWAAPELAALGRTLGDPETQELAALANRHSPELLTVDRFGHRADEVRFHPAYHRLMSLLIGAGLHSAPWADPKPGAHVARAAGYIMVAEVENGTQCPTTMTYGSVPALRRAPELQRDWLPRVLSRTYDPRFRPVTEKGGALIGMGMTEKQGGSDVRTNASRAEPAGDGSYRITGHKWFFSAPMCDAFLVLAQAPGGLSCFFLPRWKPDGTRNALRLQRLKDKLGNRSNASSEVEFHGAYGLLLGEEGRGVRTILEMGTYTRLDCALGSTGLMRGALSQAVHHARHRTAFQRRLVEQPLMANLLADLALEVEAAIALMLRLARTVDGQAEEREALLMRLMIPAAKYWICRRGPGFAAEAMEVMGGNGYVEESPMPRIYREMPVNSIWEGSGNVMCLDVLRALGRSPQAAEALLAELAPARGQDRRFDAYVGALQRGFAGAGEPQARRLVEGMVLAWQGALLLQHAPAPVADGFIASRLGEPHGGAYGTLPAGLEQEAIIARALDRDAA